MRLLITSFLISFLWVTAFAQQDNELLDRAFWRTSPTVADLKAKIAEGHDPLAMTSASFDPTVYALLEKAPFKTVKYLLDLQEGAAAKLTHDGRSYLMWAAYAGQKEATNYLIDLGSDMKMVDDHGYAVIPFCANAGMGKQEVYELLHANGADIKATNRNGANALLLIAKHLDEDLSLIDYFKSEGLALTSTDNDGNGLFNYAAAMGNMSLMKKAIAWGLPYKEKNKVGGNAMMFASQGSRGHTNGLKVYEFLAENGVAADVVTESGQTPLHNLAFRVDDPAIYTFFTERGVDINQTDEEGNTMLLNAIRGGNENIALAYLPKVADLKHQNDQGHSALTYAVRSNLPTVVSALVKEEVPVKIVDKDGNTIAGHLFQSYSDRSKDRFEEVLVILTAQNLDMQTEQEGGNNLLHLAVDKQSAYLVELALSQGVDINAKNDNGLTPLHYAAMKAKDASLLNLLIQKGADTTVKTDFEESVYDLAAENELLKKSGFNLDTLKK